PRLCGPTTSTPILSQRRIAGNDTSLRFSLQNSEELGAVTITRGDLTSPGPSQKGVYSLRAGVEFCRHAARNRLLLIRNLRLPAQICEKLVPADGTRLPTKSETTISATVVLKGSSRTVKSVKQNETDSGAEENDMHHNFYFYFSASARRSVPVGQTTTSRAVPRARQSPA